MKKRRKTLSYLVLIAIIAAAALSWNYFFLKKRCTDPRFVVENQLYTKYSETVKTRNYQDALTVLDSLENLYKKYPSYYQSFEMGTIQNNRAANWLTIALYETDSAKNSDLLDSSEFYAKKSILIFEHWLTEFSDLSRNEIIYKIKDEYNDSDSLFKNCNIVEIINNRTDKVLNAQIETRQKLSLAYTNLATVYNKKGEQEKSLYFYRKALKSWPANPTAKNNIDFMIGKSNSNRNMKDSF
jgi:tetratricopeptide (TPR) repeat protein